MRWSGKLPHIYLLKIIIIWKTAYKDEIDMDYTNNSHVFRIPHSCCLVFLI